MLEKMRNTPRNVPILKAFFSGGKISHQHFLKTTHCDFNSSTQTKILKFIFPPLQGDASLVLKAVSRKGSALESAALDLRANREIVMAAVSNQPSALEFASHDLRGDQEIVMKAVSRRGIALRFASKDWKGEREREIFEGRYSEGREWGVGSVVVGFRGFGAPRFSV